MPNNLKTISKIAEAQRLIELCNRIDGDYDADVLALRCELGDWTRLIRDLCRDRIAVLTIAGEPTVQGDPGTVIVGQRPKLDPFFLDRSRQRYGNSDPAPPGSTAGNNFGLYSVGK